MRVGVRREKRRKRRERKVVAMFDLCCVRKVRSWRVFIKELKPG